jgi:ABC-type multidrug transport system fused ATPase/permease subunit
MSAPTTRGVRTQESGFTVAAEAVRRFGGVLRGERRTLGMALAASLLYTATRLAEPWPLKIIVDGVLLPPADAGAAPEPLVPILAATLALLALALVRSVATYLGSVYRTRAGHRVALRLRRRLFAHLQLLSLTFHRSASTADLLTRLTGDVKRLRELLVTSLLTFVAETVVVVALLAVLLVVEWRLALFAAVAIPLILLAVGRHASPIDRASRKQRRHEGELASHLSQVLSGIQVVRLFTGEPRAERRMVRLSKRSMKSEMAAKRMEARLGGVAELSLAVLTAVSLCAGALEVTAGRITAGELIVFVFYMRRLYRPLRLLATTSGRASQAAISVARVAEIMDSRPGPRDGPVEAPAFAGAIRFEAVSFAYPASGPVVADVDLEIPAGCKVALVGPSGAGKSTLFGLVPRLYDPTRGKVRIDGRDVRELTLSSLRGQISVVPQDGMIFAGTVRDNVAYGHEEATAEQIESAARDAQIHDFIVSLPEGYDTELEEGGLTLSAGQRQRLEIARAFVKQAPIVLFDEPTAHLDPESEALLAAAMARLLAGRTAIVISHRLATVRNADLVVVMEHGRIVETGRHDELAARSSRYRELFSQESFLWQEAGVG